MTQPLVRAVLFLLVVASNVRFAPAQDAPRPMKQDWEYADAMKKVAARAHARPGVVLHVGDSITYANPYSQWARSGKGHTARDEAALKWMHTNAGDDSDGWHLCSADLSGGRSYTACGGIRIDEMLAGGKSDMPPLSKVLDDYRPQAIVLMLGTNDVSAGRSLDAYRADMDKAVRLTLDRGIVCILSTIPPHVGNPTLSARYNDALRQLARDHALPLIDFEREILQRRPDDWNGTLLGKGDVHPTATQGGASATSEPTAENLRNSGYLLRGWLSVEKIAEVREKVFEGERAESAKASSDAHGPGLPAGEIQSAEPLPKPGGKTMTVRLPVTRDVWFSDVGKEGEANTGAAPALKLKSMQEMSLVDLDPATLKGRVIVGATLHLHQRGPEPLRRVTVSSFNSEWVEGTAPSYQPQNGSSCFDWAKYPDVPWAYPGSDLTAVMLSDGGTRWGMADATRADEKGWIEVPVSPAVLAARVAGISHGFILFDDTGSEWTRQGEKYTSRHMPNRFVDSRDSNASVAPYFTIDLGGEDRQPPAAVTQLAIQPADRPAGEAEVTWTTPADTGGSWVAGFLVECNGKPVPPYLVPAAATPGAPTVMELRDLGLGAGEAVEVVVRAVDGAGNASQPARVSGKVSDVVDQPLPGKDPEIAKADSPLPKLGGSEVAIIDALDKVNPTTGQFVPPQEDGYLSANHLWSAKDKVVRLSAGRNEFVSFQVLFRGPVKDVQIGVENSNDGALQSRFWRFGQVQTRRGKMPDPLLPLDQSFTTPVGDANAGVLCEIYVPHELPAGKHKLTLSLQSGQDKLAIPIDLNVWDFTLPDSLSFICELNCYGLPSNERDYYRLAHLNRAAINKVPYHQNGTVDPGCAPTFKNGTLDWTEWDKRFGPLLDGSAFADLPRKGVPLDVFYLPLHENWPTPMEGNYNGSYWADLAFPPGYRAAFVEASRQFAEHFNEKHWDTTIFQGFFNGKNNFKEGGWSHGTSPWLLDEPMHFQDFWALRWFGQAFQEGVRQSPGGAKMMFRADISRPQWQRDSLDGILNYNVVNGGSFRQYHRLVMDRKRRDNQVVVTYGSSNDPADSNLQPLGWCLDAWTLGADGVLPWQVIGSAESWKRGEDTCLLYPGGPVGQKEPVPSVRLKAYLRGEQDVEYLVLLSKLRHQSQESLGRSVRAAYRLDGVRKGTGFVGAEDTGVIDFGDLRPQDLWKLRERVGRALSDAHPAAERKVVDWGRAR